MSRRAVVATRASEVARLLGVTSTCEVEITGISDDSRTVAQGDLFFCVRGASFDPHSSVRDIAASGAVAFVTDSDVDAPEGVAVIRVPDVRSVVGPVASALLDHPSRRVTMIGVTGTNGKTSTASFIGSILRGTGHRPVVLGTLTAERTTPEPVRLQADIADAVATGASHIVMEVSSHALTLGRVNGIEFDVAVFTNLSRDHIDFHGSMDAYRQAKFSLFDPARCVRAVVNVDDQAGETLASHCNVPVVRSTESELSDVTVRATDVSFVWKGHVARVPVGGRVTVENARLALEVGSLLGISPDAAVAALSRADAVPGRMEPVPTGSDYSVIVDYAHTPEALELLLSSVRAAAAGRVVVVFGCGGDRDSGKRPQMGKIAADLADVVWITSDNPRSEDPLEIIRQISEGAETGRGTVHIESDRARAIESAISQAESGDIVVVAGKGHETYQEIAGVLHDFSDVRVARDAASRRSEAK